jgi:hypothetical protein
MDRDDNSGTGNGYPADTQPDGYKYGYDFLPAGGTRTRPEPMWVRVFFPPTGNLSGTQIKLYFYF